MSKIPEKILKHYNTSQKEMNDDINDDPSFKINSNIKAEYDMWGWIYQEISNYTAEISKLSVLVRINNSNSPSNLVAYHAHIYTLLIRIRQIIHPTTWTNIDNLWLSAKLDIDNYLKKLRVTPNLRIPFELIRQLDDIYGRALIITQKVGLGIRYNVVQSSEDATERAIVGS